MRKISTKGLKAKAWKTFSEYIRRAYADRNGNAFCYTCGHALHWKNLQAGHAIPGRHNGVLLDEDIVRPQCYVCNCMRSGLHHVFATNLIKENGMDWWEKKLSDARKTVKYTRSDWENFISMYSRKLETL